jgi:protein required for attachment to host cells
METAPRQWVVVADHGRARLFQALTPSGPLSEVEDMLNPIARQHERDLVSDSPGRSAKSAGGVHPVEGDHKAREHSAELFASRVCARLSQLRCADAVSSIVLIAEPDFLGLLRRHLDGPTARLVSGEIAKSATRSEAPEIRALLDTAL